MQHYKLHYAFGRDIVYSEHQNKEIKRLNQLLKNKEEEKKQDRKNLIASFYYR